jgi:MEMO1 family protein
MLKIYRAMIRSLRRIHLYGIVLCTILLSESACYPQIKKNENMAQTNHELVNRKAYVAGQFYPGNPSELRNELNRLFTRITPQTFPNPVQALISPHAGYVFSAPVAAESFAQINRDQNYDNIFLIGSSHHVSFDGASVYARGNYETPLGTVTVNIDLAENLIKNNRCFSSRYDAQLYEHCLEVQLPFLQFWMHKPFRIVPIVLGTQNAGTCRKIAEALRPYFNKSNLFVISTDFSHYPAYSDAGITDRKTADAILTNKPEQLLKTIELNDKAGIPGLATSLCGWTSVLTLMYITGDIPGLIYRFIDYKNSGDAATVGDKSRVVGYCSIVVFPGKAVETKQQDLQDFTLTEMDRSLLLDIARETLVSYITTGIIPVVHKELSPNLLKPAGAFVSLYRKDKLRGCIGRFNPDIPLYKVVQEMVISSATKDYRFSHVEEFEIPEIKIEISVLTPLKRITHASEIVLGRDGIYVRKGSASGTFLPQVAKGTGWTVEEFLGHCSRDKAGIGWDGWKDAELYTYEALILREK